MPFFFAINNLPVTLTSSVWQACTTSSYSAMNSFLALGLIAGVALASDACDTQGACNGAVVGHMLYVVKAFLRGQHTLHLSARMPKSPHST
jgi:hypothetical protein